MPGECRIGMGRDEKGVNKNDNETRQNTRKQPHSVIQVYE